MIVRSGASTNADELPPVRRLRFIEKPVESARLLDVIAEELPRDAPRAAEAGGSARAP
jgi:hypothetical protein